MDKRPSYSMNFDLRNRRDDGAKNAEVAALRLSPQETVAMLTRDEAKYRQDTAEFASKFMGPPGDVLFRCGAGHGLCIDAYGRAQPCMGIRAPELTVDLLNGKQIDKETGRQGDGERLPDHATARLSDVLAQFAALRDMRATDPDYLARCAACFLKGLCEQCPAKSWAEHGTLDTPVAYLCQVAHAQARWLGWLGEEEHGWEVPAWRERVAPAAAVAAPRDLM
jgi:hypothetical protein